ncbi:MAG: hypothetical protein R3336_07215, partial [Phycisphaeraceae bacterium]|nr:hypothetical protein [Phycisphaeraceae bacterium]
DKRTLEGDELDEAFKLLENLVEHAGSLERRGVNFERMLEMRHEDPDGDDRLPRIRVRLPDGEIRWFWTEADEQAFLDEAGLGESDPDLDDTLGEDETDSRPQATRRELHESRDLDRLIKELAEYDLDVADYGLLQEQSVTGETLPTRFVLETGEGDDRRKIPVPNLARIPDTILEAGKKGMTIKRFKGLGEMDAEQLWDTTMNPENRVLLRVNWDAASEAEKLFSILMGEDVEPRRQYIEEHALEVKHLDV